MTLAPPPESLGSLPRGWLRPCLLLLLAERPSHGYDLLDQLAALGVERVDAAGLYRTLRAMQQEALVASRWEPSPQGPARRVYQLTDEGLDWLHASAGALHLVETALAGFRARYLAATARPVRR